MDNTQKRPGPRPQQELTADFETTVNHLAQQVASSVAEAARWHGVAEAALKRAVDAEKRLTEHAVEADIA